MQNLIFVAVIAAELLTVAKARVGRVTVCEALNSIRDHEHVAIRATLLGESSFGKLGG